MPGYQPAIYREQGGRRMVIKDGGELVVQPGGLISNSDLPVGSVADVDGLDIVENNTFIHRTKITVDSSMTITDHTTAGAQGSIELYDFPAGNIHIFGAVASLLFTRVGTNISATAALVNSIGTAQPGTDNAALTSTEANIIPSTANSLTAGAGTMDGVSTGAVSIDGTATPAKAYLNAAIPDAGSGGDDSFTVVGTVWLTWMNLGDN